jgi:cis-3-alkyl-4-acyloxetan-2-one decarboxylase
VVAAASLEKGPAPPPALAAGAVADAGPPPPDRPHAPRRALVPAAAPWGAEYPFTSRFLKLPGDEPLWLHYLDEGPREAPVVVLLHGNPTWSFYWRKLVLALSDRYRCIVPDHLGCGLSDRPQAWPYTLAGHIENARALLDALGVARFSLIVHDWGGAIGMGLATEHPEQIEDIVVTNTAAFRSKEIPPSIASVRIPVFGRFAVLQLNAFAAAATFRAVERPLAPLAKQGLLAPYSNPHDRIATLRFVEDIPMDAAHRSWDRLARIEERLGMLKEKRMLLVWGDKDFCFTKRFRARWQEYFPAAAVHAFDDVGHYVNEDAPERIVPLVRTFLDASRA